MATALKQLKEMEERVKGVPALEKEVAKLRAEKDMLLLALQEKNATMEAAQQKQQSTESSTQTTETFQTQTDKHIQSRLTSPTSPGHKGLGKSGDLKRLTEKFEVHGDKTPPPAPSKVYIKAPEKVSVVEKKTVAVGGDMPMDSVVFYYSQGVKDASEGTMVNICEIGTGTDPPLVHEEGVQVRVETEEAEVWVMESLLGLTSEAQREIDTLQDTIKFQQETIVALEDQLSVADKDLGMLRAQMEEKTSKVTYEKGVLAKPDTSNAQVETATPALKHAVVSCRPEVTDACVGEVLTADQTEQGTQTDAVEESVEPAPVVLVSTGCQCESLVEEKTEEKTEEQKVTVPKKRQMTIAEYKVSPEEEVVGTAETKEGDQAQKTTASNTKTGENQRTFLHYGVKLPSKHCRTLCLLQMFSCLTEM